MCTAFGPKVHCMRQIDLMKGSYSTVWCVGGFQTTDLLSYGRVLCCGRAVSRLRYRAHPKMTQNRVLNQSCLIRNGTTQGAWADLAIYLLTAGPYATPCRRVQGIWQVLYLGDDRFRIFLILTTQSRNLASLSKIVLISTQLYHNTEHAHMIANRWFRCGRYRAHPKMP